MLVALYRTLLFHSSLIRFLAVLPLRTGIGEGTRREQERKESSLLSYLNSPSTLSRQRYFSLAPSDEFIVNLNNAFIFFVFFFVCFRNSREGSRE